MDEPWPKPWQHDPLACDQAYSDLVADCRKVTAERDRLRAIVDALVDFRAKQDAALHADAEPEVEIGLTDIAFSAWRGVTAMLDQLDASPEATDG